MKLSQITGWFAVEAHRAYLYRLAAGVGGALVVTGQVASGDLSTDLTVLGALLGVGGSGLATVHTSTKARR